MYNTPIISYPHITDHFLPKIAKEYNLLLEPEESSTNSRDCFDNQPSYVCSPLISAGWFSTLFSNNTIQVHSQEDPSKKGKEKEKTSPNFLQWVVLGAITAIGSGFGLGKLRSAITAAEENIVYSRDILENSSHWQRTIPAHIATNIVNIAKNYYRAETERKEKLSNYQYSLMGMAGGILITTAVELLSVGVLASATVELLAIIGIITAVASAAFGAYQVGIHWNDFAKAQEEFKTLNLIKLLPQRRIPSPHPPGWRVY